LIASKFDDNTFFKEMSNVVKYAEGYLEGVKLGKPGMLAKMGLTIKTIMEEYIDTNARVDPASLHHVYEWYRTGSPDARLYNINYTVTGNGLSFNSSFSQSQVIKDGSKVPFYNKAKIVEDGIPVRIKPVQSSVLTFTIGGQQVFTKKDIVVNNPGGTAAHGGFEKTFDNFFSRYLSQSLLLSSGIIRYLENPVAYKEKLNSGKNGGKSVGFQTGYRWIVSAGVMNSV
jgi:hypothetical protein